MSSSSPAALTISARFNAEDADVILVSKDGVHFHVHKLNLSMHSVVFRDMFELGNDEGARPKIPLEEDAATLEAMLPYIYTAPIDTLFVTLPASKSLIEAFEKYQIQRGIEAARDALSFYIGGVTQPAPTATSCVAGYFYAVRHNAAELRKRSLEQLGKFELVDATTAIKASTEVETHFRASYYLLEFLTSRHLTFVAAHTDSTMSLLKTYHTRSPSCDRSIVISDWISGSTYSKMQVPPGLGGDQMKFPSWLICDACMKMGEASLRVAAAKLPKNF